MRASADIVVAGLGVLGAAAARALARRGLRVVGLDRYRPPHTLGSSHGGSRIIRRVYAEGGVYVPLVDRAFELWRDLERQSGTSLLRPGGGLSLGAADSSLIEGALSCARQHDLDHEVLDAAQLRRRFPSLRPPPGVTAVFDPAAGVLLAEPCVEALLAGSVAAGAELRFDCPLDGWRRSAGGITVECGGGTVEARAVLLATGAWLAGEPQLGTVGLVVERQVQHWFDPLPGFDPVSDLPPFVWELSSKRTWYGLPDLGLGLKAAIHHGGEQAEPESVDRTAGATETLSVRRLVERYLPHAAGPPRSTEVCLYTNTPDLGFLAGPLPGELDVWVLGGGSGHAFKFAPALGELVASGIVERRSPPALAAFRPERFAGG